MSTETLPVIDIRDLRRSATHRAIDAACREWGFFQVVDHGIDERAACRTPPRRCARSLRCRSRPSTRSCAPQRTRGASTTASSRGRRATGSRSTTTGRPTARAIVPQWPRELPGFAPAIERVLCGMRRARLRVAAKSSSGNLGMPPGALDSVFSAGTTRAFCGSTITRDARRRRDRRICRWRARAISASTITRTPAR